jgi:CHAT domain-containing protein
VLFDDPLIAVDPDFDLGENPITSTNILDFIEEKKSRISRDLDRSQIHFPRLSNTRVEGELVGDILGAQTWIEDQVLETRVKECKSPRILHIATHGFFLSNQPHNLNSGAHDDYSEVINLQRSARIGFSDWKKIENPLLRSGLALAGANTWAKGGNLSAEAEDGILTAEDVTGMDLSKTELVVLSACDTALGDVLLGEGVFGLKRSFVLAGAKALVMSLWKVPDQQTKDLMLAFYSHLSQGRPRGDALRKARISIKKEYPNPYYWGAFICQGDPGPLSDQSHR